jgi:DNA-binding PadR family transcriptional regulator
MPTEVHLTPTSYIVLGLINAIGECTPYDLKQVAAATVGQIWWLHHAQLYSEPQRLTEAGYLSERRESGGRRRRRFKITKTGREALRDWLAEPEPSTDEVRDLATVQLFFGADPKRLAEVQLPLHEEKLEEYESAKESPDPDDPPALLIAAEAGIASERIFVRFWQRLLDGEA